MVAVKIKTIAIGAAAVGVSALGLTAASAAATHTTAPPPATTAGQRTATTIDYTFPALATKGPAYLTVTGPVEPGAGIPGGTG